MKRTLIIVVLISITVTGLYAWKSFSRRITQPAPAHPFNEVPITSTVSETAQGYVTKAYLCGGTPCIDIDYIQMLTGADAKKYCAQKGISDCAPDGYVIQNDNPKVRTFSFGPNPTITYIAAYADKPLAPVAITPAQFLSIYNRMTTPPEPAYSFGKGNTLFDIQVQNGTISSLTESYLP